MRTIKRNRILGSCNFDWPPELKPDYAINPYIGCAHNCSYCWARDMTYRFREPWGIPPDFEWDKPLVVENALELLEVEMGQKKPGRVLLSSMTDPYQPIEEELKLTRGIIEHIPGQVMILTKAEHLPSRDFGLLRDNRNWFGVTITEGWDWPRKELLEVARSSGLRTFVSFEPWFPAVNAQREIGWLRWLVDYWIIGSLNRRGYAVGRNFYRRELPPFIEWMRQEGIKFYIKGELRRCMEEASDESDRAM